MLFGEMNFRKLNTNKNRIFQIRFNCYKSLKLIEYANVYDAFEKWFFHLKSKDVQIIDYAILPDSFHAVIYIPDSCEQILNTLIANGKRFIAYAIVNGLESESLPEILSILNNSCSKTELKNGALHRVFDYSFGWKDLNSMLKLIHALHEIQMLNYGDLQKPSYVTQTRQAVVDDVNHFSSTEFWQKQQFNPWISELNINSLPNIWKEIEWNKIRGPTTFYP